MPFGDDPSVEIVTPSSSTNWTAGTTQTISWLASAGSGNTINGFSLYLYNGSTQVSTIATNIAGNTTGYSWSIPQNQSGDTDYRIKIVMNYISGGN